MKDETLFEWSSTINHQKHNTTRLLANDEDGRCPYGLLLLFLLYVCFLAGHDCGVLIS
jgi:hypothetical protein